MSGPIYDIDSAALKKWRRGQGPLLTWGRAERVAYANAVETAVLAKQRALLKRAAEPSITPMCASRTWHTTGEAIDAAIRSQQRAALSAAPGRERRARTPQQWQTMYDEAMAEKRGQL